MKTVHRGLFVAVLLGLTACRSGSKTDSERGRTEDSASIRTEQQPSATEEPELQFPNPQSAPQPEPVGGAATFIPAFRFYKVKSGIEFTDADIPKRRNTVFIFFDPTCGHCQQEAGKLAVFPDLLQNVNIYFVSMNEPALMANFLETFGKGLVGKPNVEVLYDRNQEFIRRFHLPKHFPANYVYGPDGRLKNHWEGEQKDIGFILDEFTKD